MPRSSNRVADALVTVLAGLGEWTVVDKLLAAVLGVNLLAAGVVVLWPRPLAAPMVSHPATPPAPPAGPTEPPVEAGKPPAETTQAPEVRNDPPVEPPASPLPRPEPVAPRDPDRMPAHPRSRLWAEANELASQGNLGAAIARLELLLAREPSLGDVVRRAVYTQLAYYCGLADRADDARRYLRLSRSDLELGLVPDELWRMAEEAHAAGDWATARRFTARFLLSEGQMAEELKSRIPLAYLRLADGYRDEAKSTAGGEGKQ